MLSSNFTGNEWKFLQFVYATFEIIISRRFGPLNPGMFVWRFPTFGVLGPYHTPVRSSLWKCLFCKQIRCTIYRNLVGWIPCHLPFWTPLVENAKFVEHLVDKFLSIWLKSNYVGLRTFHWCQVVKCWCFGGWFDPPPPALQFLFGKFPNLDSHSFLGS